MKCIDIFYVRYYKSDGSEMSIGGIETYITELSRLVNTNNISVRIFQFSDIEFVKHTGYSIVYGVKSKKRNFDDLYAYALSKREEKSLYLNIIANDTLIPKWKVPNSIVIQHGIGFDGLKFNDKPFFFSFAYRTYKAYITLKKMNNIEEAVCVDNNYICWYRTQTPQRKIKLIPILNFTRIGPEDVKKDNDIIKLLFARRFVKMRGTHLFAPVAKRLLATYNNIEITFAGEGPEEKYLKEMFSNEKRVFFCKYDSGKAIEFHQRYNIAVVPTLYSEGTSLSLLEAMSAHCAVVCTNIGGMTNIILDHFNGMMVTPNEDELYNALSIVIRDRSFREKIAVNAYKTIRESFSIEKWQESWLKVINDKFEKKCPQ